MVPSTTFHKIKYLLPLHRAKRRGLHCTVGASTEIQGPCVPIAWEGHPNHFPVNASVFQGRDVEVS